MVRNAVDHGIESAEVRLAAGKPAQGTIRLSAMHQGGSVIIEMSDDGGGLDRRAILSRAFERGLIENDGAGMSDADVFALIFTPGFSTAKAVTEISGRGVGMDVVRRNIENLRGRVRIASTPGVGTTFRVILPLTLAIIDGMIVACGAQRYVLPTLSIIESIRPTTASLHTLATDRTVVTIRDENVPLLWLAALFGIPDAESDPTKAQIIVLETTSGKVGLVVDDVVAQQHVVIKSLGRGLASSQYLSGAAILSNGHVGLIVNPDELRRLSTQPTRGSWVRATTLPTPAAETTRREDLQPPWSAQ
jgi:two-component system, chemotaxis family, sensor kinase CheA